MSRVPFLLILIVAACQFGRPQSEVIIPDQIITILDSAYAEWSLVDNFWVVREPVPSRPDFDTAKCHPNLVWGDFDGDGKTDYALFTQRKPGTEGREQYLIAFLGRGESFENHVIKRAVYPGYIAEYIWLAKKGTRYFDHGIEEYGHLMNDGIEAVIIEKGAATYIFENGRFHGISTGD